MTALRALILVIVTLIVAGCGGAKAPEDPSGSSGAGETPRSFFAVADDANVLVVVDGSALVEEILEPMEQVLSSMPEEAEGLRQGEAECGFNPLASVKRLVFFGRLGDGGTGPSDYGVVVVEPSVSIDRAMECFVKLTQGSVDEAGWIRSEDMWAKEHGGMLFLGTDQQHVEQAFERLDQRRPPRSDVVQLAKAGLVALWAHDAQSADVTEIEIVLGDHSQQGLSRMRLVFPNARGAAEGEALVKTWLANTSNRPPPPDMEGVFEKLLSSVNVKRLDKVLRVSIHIPAAATLPEYRIALIGTAMSLAGEEMERYFLEAKIAEAKNTLSAIAKALAAHVSSTSDKRRLLPPSAPRVPAEVPKAQEYQSAPADWSGTWQTLGFKLTDPQHYSYEIETAPNRRSAVIRATGDLDGDGTFSRFELRVRIVRSGGRQVLEISKEIREVDPEE